MEKNIKIALGCFGSAIFVAGTMVGGIITEKMYSKHIGKYKDLTRTLREALIKECEINSFLQKEVVKIKREEARRNNK